MVISLANVLHRFSGIKAIEISW